MTTAAAVQNNVHYKNRQMVKQKDSQKKRLKANNNKHLHPWYPGHSRKNGYHMFLANI